MGLLVEAALLGRAFTVEHQNQRIIIDFPTRDLGPEDIVREPSDAILPDGLFGDLPPAPMVERGGLVTSSVSVGPPAGAARIQVLRTRILYEGTPSAASYGEEARPRDNDQAFEELRGVGLSAQAVVESLVDHIRVANTQYWLGLRGSAAQQLGRSELVDTDAERELPIYVTLGASTIVRVGRAESALSDGAMDVILRAVQNDDRPPFGRELLVDSAHYLEEAVPSDPPRAVLTAAIACEVRIKEFLREHASSDENLALLDLLLSSPRDYSMALVALFDRPAEVLAGRSLRLDDKDLFKRLTKLIETRNAIAHKGEFPSEELAVECIRAAFGVFRWLDEQ